MALPDRVVMEHKDGRTVSVRNTAAARRSFEEEGFKATMYDGTPDGEFIPVPKDEAVTRPVPRVEPESRSAR